MESEHGGTLSAPNPKRVQRHTDELPTLRTSSSSDHPCSAQCLCCTDQGALTGTPSLGYLGTETPALHAATPRLAC